jgi:hypothetical protein
MPPDGHPDYDEWLFRQGWQAARAAPVEFKPIEQVIEELCREDATFAAEFLAAKKAIADRAAPPITPEQRAELTKVVDGLSDFIAALTAPVQPIEWTAMTDKEWMQSQTAPAQPELEDRLVAVAEREGLLVEKPAHSDRELLAKAMVRCGFTTGHGDTVADLLRELEWQVSELRAKLAPAQPAWTTQARQEVVESAARTRPAQPAGDRVLVARHKNSIYEGYWRETGNGPHDPAYEYAWATIERIE